MRQIAAVMAMAGIMVLAPPSAGEAQEPADLVFMGGPIYTADDQTPIVEALAVRDGLITFSGDRNGAADWIGDGTEVIDLGGAALFPGFHDSHAHLLGIGLRELELNLEGTPSLAGLVETVAERAGEIDAGEVIFGRGWIETHWPEGRFPTRWDLDKAAPDNPVVLVRADGHARVLNSAALVASGIDESTPDPDGGRIERNALGEPTGMLIDRAMDLSAGLTPAPDEAKRIDAYIKAGEVYARYGWTSIHNMSVDLEDVPIIERLSDTNQLPIRVYNSIGPAGAPTLFDTGPRSSKNGRIVTRAIKLYMDGALGSRGAALLEEYSDANGRGLLVTTKDDTMPILAEALKRGIQINMHAIGDRGNRLLLDWYEEAFNSVDRADWPIPEPRWRDEHSQIVDLADIPRFANLGVIASMQPSHAIGDLHFAPDRLGPDRLEGAYAWATLIESGALVIGGSDAPVERGDPTIEFYAATVREDLDGFSGPGWHPEEAVDREAALKMFTKWAAYASFQEDTLGRLMPGLKADLVVFSQDLMTVDGDRIPDSHALMTVIDGAIAWRDPEFE